MADTKEIPPFTTELESTLIGALPSPLKPYAKALVSAIPPMLAAYAVLQSGAIGPVSVWQFIVAVATTAGVYFLKLLPDAKWQSALKTGAAILGAIVSAGFAAFGDGGRQGWIAFGAAALSALLVEVVDNVPNAAPGIQEGVAIAKQVAAGLPTWPGAPTQTFGGQGPIKVDLPTSDEVSPEG